VHFYRDVSGFGLFSGLDTPAAHADFTFGEPVSLKSVIPVFHPDYDIIECISDVGLEMYIVSFRPEGQSCRDIWLLRHAAKDEDWGPPENIEPAVDSPKNDSFPCVSADGLVLFFNPERPAAFLSTT